jgi:predicted  nucleic acid-binding Zn-ribbon protein
VENILINLTSDPSGLQPGIDGLVQMQVVDKELGDQVKKTNDDIVKGNKATSDSLSKTSTTLDKLVTSFKGLDKSVVGGAYNKTLKELQKQIEGTSDEFKQLALAVDFAKKKQQEFKPNTPEWQQLQEQIEAATTILAVFGQEQGDTEKKAVSLRAQLRGLKEDIAAALEKTNGKITPEIQVMIDKAGELDDTMKDINTTVSNVGSDTRNLDGLISLASGGIGVFSAFQGIIGLTNSESKEFEQSLVKLNSAMALLQGLQQIQNILQKESAASQLIANAQRKISVLTTQLETAAESKNTVVRYGAIGAQKVLNAVMAANPGTILLATIGAIAGAFLIFSNNSKKAKVELDDLNRSMEDSIRRGEELTQAFSATGRTDLDNLKNYIDQRRAAGASETELLNLQLQAAQKREELAKKPLALAGDSPEETKKKFEAFEKATNDQLDQLLTISSTIDDINDKIRSGGTEAEVEALKKSKETAQSQYSLTKLQYDQNSAIVKEYYQSTNDLQVATSDLQKHLADSSLKSATAYAEARVLLAKEGSKNELNAHISAIRARENEELANVNLTQGERVKIVADADKQIANLRFEYEKKALQDAKLGIDARTLKAKEGSKEELDLKLQSLQAGREIELKDKELTDNKKLEIEARYQKERQDLIRAYNKKVAEDAISGRIAELNAQNAALQLSLDATTNSQLLANKQQLIDEEAALEVLSIQESEKNEELRRLKVKAIYAKALADKQQLEKDKQKAEIDSLLTDQNSFLDREIARSQRILQNEKSTTKQRKEAQDEIFNYQQDKLSEAFNANETAHRLYLTSDEEYRNKKRELNTQQDALDVQREEAHQAQLLRTRELAQQSAISLMDSAFSIAQKGYNAEEERVKKLYDSKKISELEYNNQLKDIRRKQDKDAKAQALFTMLINQGPTLLKGFQQGGFAGIAAAFTLFFALLGSLQGTEAPAYKEGEILIKGPGTETSDSIPARLSKNESVIKASMSKKHEGALRAINEDRYIPYLMQYELPKLYQNMTMPEMPEYVQNVSNHSHAEIDYEKLGDVFAQKLAENPQHILSFDEDGFHYAVRKGNDVTNYINKKLST